MQKAFGIASCVIGALLVSPLAGVVLPASRGTFSWARVFVVGVIGAVLAPVWYRIGVRIGQRLERRQERQQLKATSETNEHATRRGKRIVLAIGILPVVFLILIVIVNGLYPVHAILLLLWGWIYWNMTKGRSWARKAFLVLLAIPLIRGTVDAFADPTDIADIILWLPVALTIAFAPSVRAFFAEPRSAEEHSTAEQNPSRTPA